MRKINLLLAAGMSNLCVNFPNAAVIAAMLQPAVNSSEQNEVQPSASVTSPLIAQNFPEAISQQQTEPSDAIENQLTSVSHLADVQPTDWAFQALQSLIERYGVIAGYRDSTYRGNRAISRYEFAAGLNAVLNRVNEIIVSGLSGQVFREDLVTLERLQREYTAELRTLRGRVDGLEARSAELTANQFSTTTNLTGQVIFAVNRGGFNGDRLVNPTGTEITNDDPNTTALYRTAIDFDTSFFGTDLLKIRLDTGSNGANDNAAGVLEPNFGSVLDFSIKPVRDGEFGLGRLYYSFAPFPDFSITLGPEIVPTDYIDKNRYANLNFQDFSTQALVNNYILFPINYQSSGAVIAWNPNNGSLTLRAMYAAADAANPSSTQANVRGVLPLTNLLYPDSGGDRGLFGDPYQSMVELEYAPSSSFALRLQYSGGNVFDNHFDVLGANFELTLSRQLGIFGRYGYGSFDNTAFGNIKPNYWMAGVAIRDLLVPGAWAGIAAGQPFIDNAVGNATQTNIEAFYNFPISNEIQITPLVQVITNPANQGDNGTIITGTLRTVLSF